MHQFNRHIFTEKVTMKEHILDMSVAVLLTVGLTVLALLYFDVLFFKHYIT